MHLIELFFTALALSMDAFAVAMCAGMAARRSYLKNAVVIGLYFGGFQAGMPLAGYFAAMWLPERVFGYASWIAFWVLCFLGGKMIISSLKDGQPGGIGASIAPAVMVPLAVATSVDALAVGASFALLQVRIIPAVSFIGITTFVLTVAGVKIGSVFGAALKSKAEFTGGAILALIGIKILSEHLGII
ncbi:MAG: manganese efflux pump MntP family protein [Oscillospiraceae bacterium]|nr:manganese efflux pump MntP family protein [Oscillospiraceae bacterium]